MLELAEKLKYVTKLENTFNFVQKLRNCGLKFKIVRNCGSAVYTTKVCKSANPQLFSRIPSFYKLAELRCSANYGVIL